MTRVYLHHTDSLSLKHSVGNLRKRSEGITPSSVSSIHSSIDNSGAVHEQEQIEIISYDEHNSAHHIGGVSSPNYATVSMKITRIIDG